jgi:nucleotide-binding universal stress UspA family protein
MSLKTNVTVPDGKVVMRAFWQRTAPERLGFRETVPVYETILVAYDDPSTETLERAVDVAEALGSTLIVTNVAAATDSAEAEEAERFAGERLDQARSFLAERGLAAELITSVGPPAEAIVKLAGERNVDLIVVGTRRKGFFERLVEGSVNQNVLRRAACDVLVVY